MEELTESYKELLLKYNAALKTLETQIAILLQDFEFKNHYNPVSLPFKRVFAVQIKGHTADQITVNKRNGIGYKRTENR